MNGVGESCDHVQATKEIEGYHPQCYQCLQVTREQFKLGVYHHLHLGRQSQDVVAVVLVTSGLAINLRMTGVDGKEEVVQHTDNIMKPVVHLLFGFQGQEEGVHADGLKIMVLLRMLGVGWSPSSEPNF